MFAHSIQHFFCRIFLAGVTVLGAVSFVRAEVYSARTSVSLVSEHESWLAGGTLWLGLRMVMDEGWHVYWRNPGDSGMAPSLELRLPAGWQAGEIRWPYPGRIVSGPLASYGYEREVLLAVPVSVPAEQSPVPVQIGAKVSWLSCQVECLPGEAELSLVLPPASAQEAPRRSDQARFFDQIRLRWPFELDELDARASVLTDQWKLDLVLPFWQEGRVEFFPFSDQLVRHAERQIFSRSQNRASLLVRRSGVSAFVPDFLEGVLVHEKGWDSRGMVKAVRIKAPVVRADSAQPAGSAAGFWLACLLAFVGGIILNAMPCVLPVLSLKVLQLVKKETDRRRALTQSVFYALGIMVSFWLLALVLFFLKSAGHSLGWGFQFQSPVFVFVMTLLLFVLALNLFGVFEFVLGAAVPARGSAFFSGILMTVVATPCTAPFMGSALGFALTRPPLEGLFVFTFLGLGLALPMTVLTVFPFFLRFVPRPGAWMLTLKQVLGFVLMGCVIWLLSVLGEQSGLPGLVKTLAVLLVCAVACWLLGRSRRLPALAVFAAALVYGLAALPGDPTGKDIVWQPYDAPAVEEARAQGRPVFIDFTAGWCLTCQVNKLAVLKSPAVLALFKQGNVALFVADWTRRDERITQALESFGRAGVPLYVYYAPGSASPRILPELLTPAILRGALKE